MKTFVNAFDRFVVKIQSHISTARNAPGWSGVKAQRSVGEFRTRQFIGRRLGLVFLGLRAEGLAHQHS
jgi:hypothetical protein